MTPRDALVGSLISEPNTNSPVMSGARLQIEGGKTLRTPDAESCKRADPGEPHAAKPARANISPRQLRDESLLLLR
jgi:hypothetical protein